MAVSSRDGGGDSGSGATCSVLHTRVSHLPFAGFGFLQVAHTVPGSFGCVFTVVAANVDGGVIVMEQARLLVVYHKSALWLGSRDLRSKAILFWPHPNMSRY